MQEVQGYLELFEKGFGFLRATDNNFQPSDDDVYVPIGMIRSKGLKEGHFIQGRASVNPKDTKRKAQLVEVDQINRIKASEIREVLSLKDQTSINPESRLNLTIAPDDSLGQILDFVIPVGKGQRGLIISPPKAGKTTILKHIARAVELNHPKVNVYALLVDERPEEVTDFRRAFDRVQVFSSSADESVRSHLRITRLVLNMAMREAEMGCDSVVLIDSLTRMGRAFNKESENNSRTLSGGLGANALELPRRFFGAARNLENGGSLSIIASILIDTGSRMDEVIFQEFKGTGNLDLVLSKLCAEKRIFPAININESGTRREELLLSDEELKRTNKFRRTLAQMREEEAMMYVLELAKNKELSR